MYNMKKCVCKDNIFSKTPQVNIYYALINVFMLSKSTNLGATLFGSAHICTRVDAQKKAKQNPADLLIAILSRRRWPVLPVRLHRSLPAWRKREKARKIPSIQYTQVIFFVDAGHTGVKQIWFFLFFFFTLVN